MSSTNIKLDSKFANFHRKQTDLEEQTVFKLTNLSTSMPSFMCYSSSSEVQPASPNPETLRP